MNFLVKKDETMKRAIRMMITFITGKIREISQKLKMDLSFWWKPRARQIVALSMAASEKANVALCGIFTATRVIFSMIFCRKFSMKTVHGRMAQNTHNCSINTSVFCSIKNHQLFPLNSFRISLQASIAILHPGGGGICNLVAYEPASLKDASGNKLYQFGQIDYSLYYNYWQKTFMKKTYCEDASYKNPEQAVRESFCPSAMVDNSGTLYAITLFGIDSKGPNFYIWKYVPSGSSILNSSNSHYFWDEACRQYGTSTDVVPNCGSNPFTSGHESDPDWIKNGVHNLFSPTIAQEVQEGNTSYIYICYLSPPLRWMNSSGSKNNHNTEGLVIVKLNKSNLSTSQIKCVARDNQYDDSTGCGYFPFRANSWSHKLQPELGPCKAAFDGTWIHYFQMANTSLNWGSLDSSLLVNLRYKKISASSLSVNAYSTINGMLKHNCEQSLIFPRFQKVDSNTYFCTSDSGDWNLGYWGTTPQQILSSGYQDQIRCDENFTPAARYISDFCVVKNGSQHIACFLGLKATGIYSDLSATYGWNNSGSNASINWNPKHLACILYSYPVSNSVSGIGSGTNLKIHPSNVIYNTTIARAANDAVNTENTTAADSKRLYLNTQNIVAYTSSSGHNYIIYAYCYPGKTKQCFLGYAPYSIDAENHIHLMTKREFRDKNGNSFGDFTNCSRIISMDLKNGHLWITFMNSDSYRYYYFYILAKDLVKE